MHTHAHIYISVSYIHTHVCTFIRNIYIEIDEHLNVMVSKLVLQAQLRLSSEFDPHWVLSNIRPRATSKLRTHIYTLHTHVHAYTNAHINKDTGWAPRGGVMIRKLVSLEQLRFSNEFDHHWAPLTFGLAPHPSYTLKSL